MLQALCLSTSSCERRELFSAKIAVSEISANFHIFLCFSILVGVFSRNRCLIKPLLLNKSGRSYKGDVIIGGGGCQTMKAWSEV